MFKTFKSFKDDVILEQPYLVVVQVASLHVPAVVFSAQLLVTSKLGVDFQFL